MIVLGIVILNFNNYKDTISCIESVFNSINTENNIQIVVVDNASNNNSVIQIHEKYQGKNNIHLISLKSNLGYAKGNNVGIEYLLENEINNIIICNPDILFPSDNIFEQLYKAREDSVGLIIPQIRNYHDGSLDQRVIYEKKLINLRLFKALLIGAMSIEVEERDGDYKIAVSDNLPEGVHEKIYAVSGSCFLLTDQFFNSYCGLYPETFLYSEEWATIIFLDRAKLKTKYVKTDPLIHIGGSSTPLKGNSWKIKAMADSSREVLKLLFMPKKLIRKKYGNKNVSRLYKKSAIKEEMEKKK